MDLDQTKIAPRICFQDLIEGLNRTKIIALIGARQTGKTTLLRQLQENLKSKWGSKFDAMHLTCDLDSIAFRQELVRDEKLLEKMMIEKTGVPLEKLSQSFYLFIDEVQKHPPLLEILKRVHDRYADRIKIIVTGSSALQIKEKAAETLAGRIEYHHIFPFTFLEAALLKEMKLKGAIPSTHSLGFVTNLMDQLLVGELDRNLLEELQTKRVWFESIVREDEQDFFASGLYPEVLLQNTREEKFRILENYLATYVERDVRNLANVGDWQGFHRLLEVLASRTGQVVDYNKIALKAGLDVRTVKKYLSILEETFITTILSSYFFNVEKRVSKSPKILFNDNGILSTLLKITDIHHYETLGMAGRIFENAILVELMKQLKNRPLPCGIYFWRTYSQTEVDCVLESEGRLIPIEIKWSKELEEKDFSGLKSFREEFKKRFIRGYILYRGIKPIYHPSGSFIAIPYHMLFC